MERAKKKKKRYRNKAQVSQYRIMGMHGKVMCGRGAGCEVYLRVCQTQRPSSRGESESQEIAELSDQVPPLPLIESLEWGANLPPEIHELCKPLTQKLEEKVHTMFNCIRAERVL